MPHYIYHNYAGLQCTYSIVASTVDEYECEEIAEAVSGMFTDKITEKFQQLTKFLVNLLEYLLHIRCSIESKADLVKAYFVCYKQVLNFEYKGKGLHTVSLFVHL